MSEPEYHDKDWLREQYVDLGKSVNKIAEEVGCSNTTISRWLKRHDIETRPPGPQHVAELRDKAWLREQYLEVGKTADQIAHELDCATSTVQYWLNNHEIEARDAKPQVTAPELENEEWLKEQYYGNDKSTIQIAQELGCSSATVTRWFKKHGIKTGYERVPKLRNEQWLKQQYADLEKPARQVADELNCSKTAVVYWLKEHGIQVRDRVEGQKIKALQNENWLKKQYLEVEKTAGGIADEVGCSKSSVLKWLNEHGIETRESGVGPVAPELRDKNWLIEQYLNQHKTLREIGNRLGCSESAVQYWLIKHGIERRYGKKGEDHHWYTGGFEPYGPGWTEKKKRRVRKRDGKVCQDPNCSTTQEEHLKKHGVKLHVHHLIKARDIDNPEERNSMENLITLCRSCHQRWEQIADSGIKPEIIR